MTVKANWHVGAPVADTDDPFADQARVEEVGKPIDLRGEPELNQRLIALIDHEAELFNRGVTCAIKDDNSTTCSACPIRHRGADAIALLCRVGVEQERVLTELAVRRHAR